MATHAQTFRIKSYRDVTNNRSYNALRLNEESYNVQLLAKALRASDTVFGYYSLEPYYQEIPVRRLVSETARGEKINVLWAPAFEQNKIPGILPVYTPTMRGVGGYRIALCLRKNCLKLSKAKNIDDLKALSIGQDINWKDTQILRDNGLNVVTGNDLVSLFRMLKLERFDVLFLGLDQVHEFYLRYKDEIPDLEIEPKIAIHYPLPYIFYTDAQEPRLAKRIKIGLALSEKNGQSKRLFERFFGKTVAAVNLPARRIIPLNNQYIDTTISEKDPDSGIIKTLPPSALSR